MLFVRAVFLKFDSSHRLWRIEDFFEAIVRTSVSPITTLSELIGLLALCWYLAATFGVVWTVSLLQRRSSLREWFAITAFWAALVAAAIGIWA